MPSGCDVNVTRGKGYIHNKQHIEEPEQSLSPRSGRMSQMFGHMFRRPTSADLRRRALTLIEVVAGQTRPLVFWRFCCIMFLLALVYVYYVLPLGWLNEQPFLEQAVGDGGQRAGGIYSEVSWVYALALSLGYVSIVFVGVRWMGARRPIRGYIFELMASYNCLQAEPEP